MILPVAAVSFGMSVAYLAFLVVMMKRQIITLPPPLVIGVIIGIVFMIAAFLISHMTDSQVVRWLFDLGQEKNVPSIFSSVLLLSVGLTGLWIGYKIAGQREQWLLAGYWILLGALFVLLGFDEYYVLHERILSWHLIYAIMGAVVVAATGLTAWLLDRSHLRLYALIILGLAVIGFGGIGFDWRGSPIPFGYVFRFSVEEYLEYIGITLVLFVVLTYLRQRIDAEGWRRAARLEIVVNVIWIFGALFWTFWPPSWFEVQNAAEQVSVEFLDGDLALIAYSVENDTLMPGYLKVSEYWRANAPLYATYAHALKLLDPQTDAVITQVNVSIHPDLPPTEGWIPGLIYKKVIYFPAESLAPADYTLALQVWEEPEAVTTLTITQTDLPVVQPDMVALRTLTIPAA